MSSIVILMFREFLQLPLTFKYCRSAGNKIPSSPATEAKFILKVDDLHLAKFITSCWNYSLIEKQKLKESFRQPAFWQYTC